VKKITYNDALEAKAGAKRLASQVPLNAIAIQLYLMDSPSSIGSQNIQDHATEYRNLSAVVKGLLTVPMQ